MPCAVLQIIEGGRSGRVGFCERQRQHVLAPERLVNTHLNTTRCTKSSARQQEISLTREELITTRETDHSQLREGKVKKALIESQNTAPTQARIYRPKVRLLQ